jgi:hypothetical protein
MSPGRASERFSWRRLDRVPPAWDGSRMAIPGELRVRIESDGGIEGICT